MMFHPTRIIATIVFILAIGFTLFAALYVRFIHKQVFSVPAGWKLSSCVVGSDNTTCCTCMVHNYLYPRSSELH